jgi:uncharacterized protein (DUF302 family)
MAVAARKWEELPVFDHERIPAFCAFTPPAGHCVRSGKTGNRSGNPMSFKNRVAASLVLSLAICTGLATAHAADDGLITKPSRYSVKETVARFEAAVKQKEAAGFTVFTEIDHAAAARKFGLEMRPRTLILFGNPKVGTPSVIKTPLLAIDLPPKALVWEDDQGKVWLSYNSSDYLFNTIYKRHGAEVPAATAPIAKVLDEMSDQATK